MTKRARTAPRTTPSRSAPTARSAGLGAVPSRKSCIPSSRAGLDHAGKLPAWLGGPLPRRPSRAPIGAGSAGFDSGAHGGYLAKRFTHRFSRLVSLRFRKSEGLRQGDRSRSISSLGARSRLLPAADGRLQETAVVQTKTPAICGDYGRERGVRPALRPCRRTYRSSSEPTRIYEVDSRITKKRDSPKGASGAHWATNPRLIEGAEDARTRS
jgi:hypothetical protein